MLVSNKSSFWLFIMLFVLSSSNYAKIPEPISKAFAPSKIEFKHINLIAPDIAENGDVVPINLGPFTLDEPGVYITEISFYRQDNPDTPIARFKLVSGNNVNGIGTRIKLPKSTVVYVIAKLNDGRVFAAEKNIKVTIGGCGGGGGTVSSFNPSYRTPAYTPPVAVPNRERYARYTSNPIKLVSEQPVSTFSIDVDTGSYANVRRFINAGHLPVKDAVRVEEMINYFSYQYPVPEDRSIPFSVSTEAVRSPWKKDSYLLRIGLKGYELPASQLPPTNLVFLLDVSGSMNAPNKLPLLKSAMTLLSRQMRDQDRVSIVVYAGASGVVLNPVAGNQAAVIEGALNRLSAGGSTNGGAGIQLVYHLARQSFIPDGINRIVLATDGDFNVGTVNFDGLLQRVKQQRKSGITLTTLGFGMGNYNDKLIEQLADAGNGNYAYIDTLKEAQKVLVQQMAGTLNTIARDVKIQIEFNPSLVAEYRLVGYENRMLKREDFNNDKIDAGDIGAGHTVTAMYEITLNNSQHRRIDKLRYGKVKKPQTKSKSNELAYLKLRYKLPNEIKSQLLEQPMLSSMLKDKINTASSDFRFAIAVASLGQLLRGDEYMDNFNMDAVLELAKSSRGEDQHGYRSEFLQLAKLVKSMQPREMAIHH